MLLVLNLFYWPKYVLSECHLFTQMKMNHTHRLPEEEDRYDDIIFVYLCYKNSSSYLNGVNVVTGLTYNPSRLLIF